MWFYILCPLLLPLILQPVTGILKFANVNGKNISIEDWKAPDEISKKFPYYISGRDNENRPILIMEFGKWDMRWAIESGGSAKRNFQLQLQQIFYRVWQAGKNFPNGTDNDAVDTAVIVDWDNFSLTQFASAPTIEFFLKVLSSFQEIQGSIAYGFFVNANSLASTLIEIAKPVMGSVMERIEVHGTQKIRWIPRILRKFPSSQIPPLYGGDKDFIQAVTTWP